MPDDLAAIFVEVSAHRLLLSPKARLANQTAEDILAEILKEVKMPVTGESSLVAAKGKHK